MRAVYPGSFSPPTIGHIEIVKTAIKRFEINEIDLVISKVALGKEKLIRPSASDRLEIVEKSLSSIPEAAVFETSKQLIADIADGYDLVVLGADKWAQLQDLAFYENEAHMRDCLNRLPALAVAPRNGIQVPKEILLKVSDEINLISSSAVRRGKLEWMTEEAKKYAKANNCWGFN